MSTDQPEITDSESDPFIEDGVLYDDEVTPEYGVLGFTLRELLIVAVWVVAFVLSFFPLGGSASIWALGIQWILPIGLPTVAVFLLVLRRFSPDGIRRVGSLGIDQFASVAFSVSATVWLGSLWGAVAASVEYGGWTLPWNALLQVLTALALVAFTVFAPIVPGLKEDFQGRLVTLAHRNANPVRPVIPRPKPVAAETAPVASEDVTADPEASARESDAVAGTPQNDSATMVLDLELSGAHTTDEIARSDFAGQVPTAAHASNGDTGTEETTSEDAYVPSYSRRSRGQDAEEQSGSDEIDALLADQSPEPAVGPDDVTDLDATNPREQAPAPQPFWILAPTERDVHDERGETLFRIGPDAWALVIEDRGGAYVVRHDDGRIGYLHDVADIAKG
ncbi:hypothetical protein [Microbacterium aurantiacum]|uniref:hypothetical protein n=1 Tax=Microbacterium aurantiacum TaxID=162393 RepID=UPI000C807164|nr:hypothetical protein [Microbacterium aurantiacum]